MRKLAFALAASALATPALATEYFELQDGRNAAGLALITAPDYLGSDNNEGGFAPLLRLQFGGERYVSLLGGRLQANLVDDKQFAAGPVLNRRAERDDVKEDAVDAMKDIDAATEAGLFGAYKMGLGAGSLTLQARYLTDVSDTHDGSLVEVEANYAQKMAQGCTVGVLAGTTWGDHDYMNTYFGVNAADAVRSGLPVFDADGGSRDVRITPYMLHDIGNSWTLVGLVQLQRLVSDPSDSPVVDDVGSETQISAAAGALYRF